MRIRGPALAAIAAALLVAAPASARVLEHDSFGDPAGDGAIDITRVTVSSNASGAVTFVIEANRTELADGEYAFVVVDADRNPATGEQPDGADLYLQLDSEGAAVFRWNGSTFAHVPSQTVYGYVFDGLRLAVNVSDLGLAPGPLKFWVETQAGDSIDDAPDGQFFEYALSSQPLRLSVRAAAALAKTVKVGGRFVVGMQAHRSDLDELTSAGVVRCAARVGKRAVKVQAAFPEDVALCVGTAPKLAKGKTIQVTVTLLLDGQRVSRTLPVKVR